LFLDKHDTHRHKQKEVPIFFCIQKDQIKSKKKKKQKKKERENKKTYGISTFLWDYVFFKNQKENKIIRKIKIKSKKNKFLQRLETATNC
jgi:hypothetical protein